jgi:hypothetical protein
MRRLTKAKLIGGLFMSQKLQLAVNAVNRGLATGSVPFSVWRIQEGYRSRDDLYIDMMENGATEEEFDDAVAEILNEYSEFCDTNGLKEDMDEDF